MPDIELDDVMLKDLLACCGPKVEICLTHRETPDDHFQQTIGCRADDKILRWMNAIVLAFRWEKGKTVQIAVEGMPFEAKKEGVSA